MTCIVGVRKGRHVILGGDSAATSGTRLDIRRDPKVVINDGILIGFTSSFRMGQILAHAFKPPKPTRDLFRYMVVDFVDALRAALKAGGYAASTNGEERGGTFLVGVRGRLFRVESDYQVTENVCGYDAVGCGADVAMGSLHASGRAGWAPHVRANAALRAAEAMNSEVRSPFLWVESK